MSIPAQIPAKKMDWKKYFGMILDNLFGGLPRGQ
jgi:hypothetical protein